MHSSRISFSATKYSWFTNRCWMILYSLVSMPTCSDTSEWMPIVNHIGLLIQWLDQFIDIWHESSSSSIWCSIYAIAMPALNFHLMIIHRCIILMVFWSCLLLNRMIFSRFLSCGILCILMCRFFSISSSLLVGWSCRIPFRVGRGFVTLWACSDTG